ncbi:hypothetical protein HXY33_04990 [Candidatus Bathyarchaeota archaeon]|nr:hypothetical protein [Candidatus Bathyarchaeota archaeon]
MVEKRILVFTTLSMLVLLSISAGSAAYYYMEQNRYAEQLQEKQQLLTMLTENYDVAVSKRNLLGGDYSLLFGEYQRFVGENYSALIGEYDVLLLNLRGNYTSALNAFPELNESYNLLLSEFQLISQKGTVTKAEFGSLLDGFYRLFTSLAMRELDSYTGELNLIDVRLSINYSNSSTEWHNVSVSLGTTLFELTREVAEVEYSYDPTMEPGHILVSSINNYADGFWVWYYWDTAASVWVFGPVGCDAWILRNNGVYNWTCIK